MSKIKTDRSIIPFLLLSFLTLGIYEFWYLHHLVKDVNELCKDTGIKSPGIGMFLLLSLLTCGVYSYFWWYRLADMLRRAADKRGLAVEINGGTVLICMILGNLMCGIASWVGIHQIFSATNELAVDYNARSESASL